MVDKDLFLHDLSVVAILKKEGPYLKEWLDYHLMAGVDHFYLYDNESPDNQAEVAKPYVEAGLVTYIPFPGEKMQYPAYNDAIKQFKFQSRYMAFIDGDEFIFPKQSNGGEGIVGVVDEILFKDPNAAGLAIKWHLFGSNGHEKADYSRGVLERFTRRKQDSAALIKTIANPRKIDYKGNAHKQNYFEGFYSIDENGYIVKSGWCNKEDIFCKKKIVIHHYYTKSREEYLSKLLRGPADEHKGYEIDRFNYHDRNDEFDDSILKYRDEQAKIYQPPDNSHADERLLAALERNLAPTLSEDTPPEFYAGKMETLLTCRAVASYLKTKLTDDELAKSFEETSLKAVLKSLNKMSVADAQLLMRELPNILNLPYPVIKEISLGIIQHFPRIMKGLNIEIAWDCFINLLIRELPNIFSLPYPVIKEIFVEIIQHTPQIMKYLFFKDARDCFIKFHHLQAFLCETYNLKQPAAARIDIKLMTTTGDFQILSVSDDKATVWKPSWLQKNSIGYQIQSYWTVDKLEIAAKSTVDGQINLALKGLDVRPPEDSSKKFSYWVDYTKLTVNRQIIFDKVTPAWHYKPYNHTFDVKADDEIKIQVEWQPHMSDD